MSPASRLGRVAAIAVLWLPYVAPALCTVLLPRPVMAHETCQEPEPRPSLTVIQSHASCVLGQCANAPTAPPAETVPVLTEFSWRQLPQPEIVTGLPSASVAPPTHPPQR